ncbi:MAG TPA: phytoene desaturase family protein [Mycobacteriales bacterium]|nr:phytoene desaturase family protein [Mycobacteriales bacterium]
MRTVPGATHRVVVIGAGLSGLSAALRLRGAGREVTVVERSHQPGGLAGTLSAGGYHFDTGPTVLTMPELIDDALACVGERREDWLELTPLAPAYRMFFPGGDHFDIHSDVERTAAGIAEFANPAAADGYRKFVAWVERLYALEMRDFIDRNLDSPADLLRPALARLAATGGFRRLDGAARRFLRDPRIRRAFTFQSLYAGLSPYDALALYAVISYMDTVHGVYFPAGGIHAVPLALAAAGEKNGIAFRYGTGVTQIARSNQRATGVILDDGERIPADAVVLATDPSQLLGRPRRRLRMAPSCVVLHAGGSSTYRQISHHNVHFGQPWSGTFADVIDRGQLMSDPSLLVGNPSRTDPSLAPPGKQIYYVLAPVPNRHDSPIDWARLGPHYRDELLRILDRRGYVGLDLEVAEFVTPLDWELAGQPAGTPFSVAHTFGQTGPFRPGNLASGWENVVLAGAGTTPGVGVPMVLISGRLAAERITGR